MANKSTVMKPANALHFCKSYSRSNVLKTAWKMVRQKFLNTIISAACVFLKDVYIQLLGSLWDVFHATKLVKVE